MSRRGLQTDLYNMKRCLAGLRWYLLAHEARGEQKILRHLRKNHWVPFTESVTLRLEPGLPSLFEWTLKIWFSCEGSLKCISCKWSTKRCIGLELGLRMKRRGCLQQHSCAAQHHESLAQARPQQTAVTVTVWARGFQYFCNINGPIHSECLDSIISYSNKARML